MAYDASGNLTYDGVFQYTYDAWNRLVKVTKAYRSGGAIQLGSEISLRSYDGLGRRITKQVKNSADWDCTVDYYYDGQKAIEQRNGSGQVLKQMVWGGQYIDELVQLGWNQDPNHASSGTNQENNCERFFWVCQDANFNLLGLLDATGKLAERYEYTPYGQRTVFSHGYRLSDVDDNEVVDGSDYFVLDRGLDLVRGDLDGTGAIDASDYFIIDKEYTDRANLCNKDPKVLYPLLAGFRGKVNGSSVSPIGLCEFGHQGLMHDEESGIVYNRARALHPILGRFAQRDPLGYVDGMELYQYVNGRPIGMTDPSGLRCCTWNDRCCTEWTPGWKVYNFSSKLHCFAWYVIDLIPGLPINADISSLFKYAISGAKGSAGGVVMLGDLAVQGWLIGKAYDICNDEFCSKVRHADGVSGLFGKRCGCLDGKGHLGDLQSIGDRRSP